MDRQPLRARVPRWLPWVVFLGSLGLVGAAIYLNWRVADLVPGQRRLVWSDILWGLSFMAFPAVGAIIASSRPGNVIGWILLGIGALLGPGLFVTEYVHYVVQTGNGSRTVAAYLAWFASWYIELAFLLVPSLFLLFPSGRLPSPRWRHPARAFVGVYLAALVADAFSPGPLEGGDGLRNPLGIEAAGSVLETAGAVLFAGFGVAAAVASLSPFLRLRRAQGSERQQLKWFAYAAALVPVVFLTLMVGDAYGEVGDSVAGLLFVAAVLGLAGSIGVAVLRYRLYDIDVLINRTLVYGSLSAILALTYLALVTGVSSLAGDSPVTVAASTLAVAALFQPLRRRIQDFIDHRFYRRKYDAEKTLEAFSARLRDEIDLDTLSDELLAVVQRTMQPSAVSLWLRGKPT
ncbi:MAG: hypothetical protein ABR575_07695 [Actinomycetota bacterium]